MGRTKTNVYKYFSEIIKKWAKLYTMRELFAGTGLMFTA
jgi:hypothetical protein